MKKRTERMNVVYEAPQVDIIEVAVEKGFASSGNGSISIEDLTEEEW